MANQDISLRILASASGAQAAFAQVQKGLRDVGSASGRVFDPLTESVGRATNSLAELRTRLGPIQSLLSFAGAGLGARELVQLADSFGQMTARLRLATQYTGDFEEVQARLKQAADDTRAPLEATVDLYTKLAPALNTLGKSGAAAVGLLTTINQSIALSGASAQASQASLTQFAQAMGSGTFRGDEYNSVLEQTPSVIDAIARGLGKTRAELRQMANDGALSAEIVLGALEKVADSVDADFRQLPMTVGQALTVLQNQLLDVVGTADQGSGALQGVARAIVFVAEGIQNFSGAGEALRPFVEFVINAIDGVSRLFRIVATGLAGYTLAIEQALSGNLDGALATYRSIGDEVQKILDEPLADQKRTVAAAEDGARARLKVETDLATEIGKLEKLRAVAAGEANAEILLDDKALQAKRIEEARKATTEQLKGTERLRDALRTAWSGAIEGARKAREEAAALFQQAAEARTAGTDKAASRRLAGLSDEDRSAAAAREARELRDAASGSAARAVIKAYEGDLKGAERLAAEAAKQAERAEKFADMVTDDDTAQGLFEELASIREQALQAQARIKQQEARAQEETAAAVEQKLQEAEARIVELKAELEKPVTIQLDISAAEARIKVLQAQLAQLAKLGGAAGGGAELSPAEQTTTVEADTAQAETALEEVKSAVEAIPDRKVVKVDILRSGSSFADEASAFNSAQNGFASGGAVFGKGTGTSDSILARLSNGEFVLRAAAVRRYGLDFLHSINSMRLPRFASGGLVSNAVAPALSGAPAAAMVPSQLNFPGIGSFPVQSSEDVRDQMVRALRLAALQKGGRKA